MYPQTDKPNYWPWSWNSENFALWLDGFQNLNFRVKARWYYQLHKRQTQLPRIFTISNQKVGWLLFRRTNQRGCQGCWPIKLKLSAADSEKLNFSQCTSSYPGKDLAQLTDQARANLAFQIWIESENSWHLRLAFIQLVISLPFNSIFLLRSISILDYKKAQLVTSLEVFQRWVYTIKEKICE